MGTRSALRAPCPKSWPRKQIASSVSLARLFTVVLEAIEVARNASLVSVRWIAKHLLGEHMVQPQGLAVVLAKAPQIPGQGAVAL